MSQYFRLAAKAAEMTPSAGSHQQLLALGTQSLSLTETAPTIFEQQTAMNMNSNDLRQNETAESIVLAENCLH